MQKYDLHTHTHYSDGVLSPSKLLMKAKEVGLKGISITDHDSIEGLFKIEKEALKIDVEVINGVEIQGMGTEILGYFFNKEDSSLNMLLEKQRAQRKKYIKKKIEGLLEYGIEIEYQEVLKNSGIGENPNTYNIAKVMVEKGYCRDEDFAFKEYLREIPVRLEVPPTRTKKIIRVIKDAGGKAVLPHPWYLREHQKAEFESLIIRLVDEGLSGVETKGYIPEEVKMYKNKPFMEKVKDLCKKFELIETGGSDFHGENTNKNNILGKYTDSKKTIEILRK